MVNRKCEAEGFVSEQQLPVVGLEQRASLSASTHAAWVLVES